MACLSFLAKKLGMYCMLVLSSYSQSLLLLIWHALVSITGTTMLVPYQYIKALQLIRRSGTRRWNLWVPDLQMCCRVLDNMIGYQDNSSSNGCQTTRPIVCVCVCFWSVICADRRDSLGGCFLSCGNFYASNWNVKISLPQWKLTVCVKG